MTSPYNPLAFPVVLHTPDWLPPNTPADGRLPLAKLVVAMLEPTLVVELGVGRGETYAALCQAVQELRLATQCVGIEVNGPAAATADRPEVAVEFRSHHGARYGGFSRLMPGEAQGVAAHFADGSVDLLHLSAGLNRAEIGGTFSQWLPKLSARGAVLVSNINSAGDTQSLNTFWADTKQDYPHFELYQGQGLGLLLVGAEPSESLAQLTRLPAEDGVALRELLFRLGQAAAASTLDDSPSRAAIRSLEEPLAEMDRSLLAKVSEIASLNQTLHDQAEHLDQLQGRLDIVTAREREIRTLYLDLHNQLLHRDQNAGKFAEKDRIIASRDETIARLQKEQARAQAEAAAEKDRLITARDEALAEKNRLITVRDESVTRLRAELALAQAEIRTIHAGRIWRLALVYWQIQNRFLSLFRRPPARAQ